MSGGQRHWVKINRAPVLTLWAAVVAERLGFGRDEALTLGRAVAGLNAYAKGKRLGLFQPTPEAVRQKRKEVPSGHSAHVRRKASPRTSTRRLLVASSRVRCYLPLWRSFCMEA